MDMKKSLNLKNVGKVYPHQNQNKVYLNLLHNKKYCTYIMESLEEMMRFQKFYILYFENPYIK